MWQTTDEFSERAMDGYFKVEHNIMCVMLLALHDGNTTLGPGDYDSFAASILSGNHRQIKITESILASRKVVIEGVSPNNDVINNTATSLTAEGELSFFQL